MSGCITEKHNRFHIVRLEFAKTLPQKFLPINIIYKPVSKYTKIINCYFSSKLNLAFRSTFNENSKIRHNTAFQCHYCLNWYGRKDKFDQHLNCCVGKPGCVYNFNPNLGGRGNFTLHWFSLNNSKMVKAVTQAVTHFAAPSNILSETFWPNLASIARPSLQILGKTLKVVFPISGFLINPL